MLAYFGHPNTEWVSIQYSYSSEDPCPVFHGLYIWEVSRDT